MARRDSAAAFKFGAFSKQQLKLLSWWHADSPYADYDMIICDGAIRSGKTIAMITSFLAWSQTFEDQNFILAGRTMGALTKNVLQPLFRICRALRIPYHHDRADHSITIGTNTYYCYGAPTEASQDVLQGLTAAGALADEAALFPTNFLVQMIGRCSVDGAKIWWNCNPEGPYHEVKTEYIDQAAAKRILHLHFVLDDNLTLSEAVKARYRRMYTGLWFKRMILGLWVLAEGAVYDMWDEETCCADPPPGVQVNGYDVGIDYGTGNPTCFELAIRAADGVTYLAAEHYYAPNPKEGRRSRTDAEFVDDYFAWRDVHVPALQRQRVTIYVDPSAASLKAEFTRRCGACGGTRDSRGICDTCGASVAARVGDAVNDVVDGIRYLSMRLLDGTLKISQLGCPMLCRQMAGYLWDPKAQARGEDAPIKVDDHAPDSARYVVFTPNAPSQGPGRRMVTLPIDLQSRFKRR